MLRLKSLTTKPEFASSGCAQAAELDMVSRRPLPDKLGDKLRLQDILEIHAPKSQ